ncbi:hypothetical protein DFH07DRAFT_780235 [Mycena maculata]|uniref:Uncharacterized protein n=1 Tax=Mycena maculata TaxID=230809 RepID=A0AAD7I494_9AGAR|nr:hypothetical protein DFH07DRAFT_780235 [Mycena maculata]
MEACSQSMRQRYLGRRARAWGMGHGGGKRGQRDHKEREGGGGVQGHRNMQGGNERHHRAGAQSPNVWCTAQMQQKGTGAAVRSVKVAGGTSTKRKEPLSRGTELERGACSLEVVPGLDAVPEAWPRGVQRWRGVRAEAWPCMRWRRAQRARPVRLAFTVTYGPQARVQLRIPVYCENGAGEERSSGETSSRGNAGWAGARSRCAHMDTDKMELEMWKAACWKVDGSPEPADEGIGDSHRVGMRNVSKGGTVSARPRRVHGGWELTLAPIPQRKFA